MGIFKNKQKIRDQYFEILTLRKKLAEALERNNSLKAILFGSLPNFIHEVYEVPEPVSLENQILFQIEYRQEVLPEKIDNVLKEVSLSFRERLFEIIREKNLDEVTVYKNADIDRRHFSKIRSSDAYHPTKSTIVLLSLSMKLSLDEAQDLLSRCGFVLSRSLKRDIIAEYFLSRKIYDVLLYKEILLEYNLIQEK